MQTNNSFELSAFERMPDEFTTKFWEIQDIHRLYQLHDSLATRFRQRGNPVLKLDKEFGGDAVQYVAKAVVEDSFRDQVGTGYLAETSYGFRPTIKGSLIIAWQELWPLKAIRRLRERKHAQSLLAKIEA